MCVPIYGVKNPNGCTTLLLWFTTLLLGCTTLLWGRVRAIVLCIQRPSLVATCVQAAHLHRFHDFCMFLLFAGALPHSSACALHFIDDCLLYGI